MGIYLPKDASKRRIREAQHARDNRAELVYALSQGQISRREAFRWGLFTAAGMLLAKNGFSPFAKSAFAEVPTGVPRSPMFGAVPFSHPLHRLVYNEPYPMTKVVMPNGEWEGKFPDGLINPHHQGYAEPNAKRLSWHTDFNNHPAGNTAANPYINPVSGRGPCEGRPHGEWFAHQRWKEHFPEVCYLLSIGPCEAGTYFHDSMPDQDANSVWSFQGGSLGTQGILPPPLIKGRYGEPILMRIYNNLPLDRHLNNGFGRNEISTHFHNAHNGAESDGASNAFHFPGTFYDYHWGTTMARADMINLDASDPRCSGPDGNGGLIHVPGDWREAQGTMWFHDHRFFFTSENVYKGNAAMINYYSGPDRGNETLEDGVNLRLPSGSQLDYGNLDFDVNLLIADWATDPNGQYFFDIFNTDGFLGDHLHVNFQYAPYMEVLPRKYRFRILNACMSRFLKLLFARSNGQRVPFMFIANDGNFVVHPFTMNELDWQGIAERYDVVIDFSDIQIGDFVDLVNLAEHDDGRGPEDDPVPLAEALSGTGAVERDPCVGRVMRFRVVSTVQSVDNPSHTYDWFNINPLDRDPSQVPLQLTEQIPIVTPVRERHVEWVRGGQDDSRQADGRCIPDCDNLPEFFRESFPWKVKVDGQDAHSLNANRISLLIPKPGEVEHWTYENGGGGWDHPIHLHFEEGVTMNRGGDAISLTELMVRKDVWRLREGGSVKFQVRFGEYGGAYVNHCHNTVHEDFAMLLRYDILTDPDNPKNSDVHVTVIPTPMPTEDGVTYMTPEALAEGIPAGYSLNPDGTVDGPPDDGDGTPGSGVPPITGTAKRSRAGLQVTKKRGKRGVERRSRKSKRGSF